MTGGPRTPKQLTRTGSVLGDAVSDLAIEFELDAELVERLAVIYLKKDMNLQYEVLWHEGAVYRSTADRLRSVLEAQMFRSTQSRESRES